MSRDLEAAVPLRHVAHDRYVVDDGRHQHGGLQPGELLAPLRGQRSPLARNRDDAMGMVSEDVLVIPPNLEGLRCAADYLQLEVRHKHIVEDQLRYSLKKWPGSLPRRCRTPSVRHHVDGASEYPANDHPLVVWGPCGQRAVRDAEDHHLRFEEADRESHDDQPVVPPASRAATTHAGVRLCVVVVAAAATSVRSRTQSVPPLPVFLSLFLLRW
mmetsp:Transcript_34932/g.56217  ORF Transcript_34932/g.56217 Transcript_34932/m.56217 type:complete len:214 (+) Transcript_34932:976-1617(+)